MSGIGWAVEKLKDGYIVRRENWNGRNMWIELQPPGDNSKMTLPFVFVKTSQGDLVPWSCGQADLLANDWGLAL